MCTILKMQFVALVFVLGACSATGQPPGVENFYNRQAIFYELGGHTRSILSCSYERFFKGPVKNTLWSARTGIGISPGESERDIPSVTSIPVVLSLLVGKTKHFVDLSVGWTASWGRNKIDSLQSPPMVYQRFESAYVLTLAYRLMKIDHVMFEVGPTALWTNNPGQRFQWSFTIIVGEAF